MKKGLHCCSRTTNVMCDEVGAGSAGAKAAYEYGLLPRESLASRAGTLQVWIIGTIGVSICIDGFDCKAAGLRKEGQEQAFRRLK